MSVNTVDGIRDEWNDLEKEFTQLEEHHRTYCRAVNEVKVLQNKCISDISHQRHCVKSMIENIKKLRKQILTDTEKEELNKIDKNITDTKKQFHELEDVLPHENGYYLKVILGSVNVSLLSKLDKYKYKEDYEQFKLIITLICIFGSFIFWLALPYRVSDAMFQFLLVWYYCTLTIREHILKVNGSRIKGWWILHHFISTFCAGIILIWPDGYSYTQFRSIFFLFTIYMSMVQLTKYYYQRGVLYRLRSLGERRDMDITVEGFQSFMWKGLSFVLPFLVGAYIFQLYLAYVLYLLSNNDQTKEWHVLVLCVTFFVLFLGNTMTLFAVLRQKIKETATKSSYFKLMNKYANRIPYKLHKYKWT